MEDIRFNQAALAELFNSPNGEVAKDLSRRSLKVERAAKRLAPVDTGTLRGSITWTLGVDGIGLYALIGSAVEYAIYQELGTANMDAHPYLRPALAAAQ